MIEKQVCIVRYVYIEWRAT